MYLVLPLRAPARCLALFVVVIGIPLAVGYFSSSGGESMQASAPAPVYQGGNDKCRLALTVNVDWGEEYLPSMLALLRRNKVRVTFFPTGQWVRKFPALTREMARDFEVGSHGYGHRHPDRLSVGENLEDMKRAETVIKEITTKRPVDYAPPYGECGSQVLEAAAQLEYRVILWSIDAVDWRLPPASAISEKVISRAHNGAIVLLHPTAPTVEALPVIIKELRGRGYEFVTVAELLEAK